MITPLLEVRGLRMEFGTGPAAHPVLHGVDLTLERGRVAALVGASGSGKSLTARALLGLLPAGARITGGSALFHAGMAGGAASPSPAPCVDLLRAGEALLQTLRGRRIGMIFQDPLSSLNPLHTVERQLTEPLALHRGMRGPAARARALELLDLVRLDAPESRLRAFPHQLSGGQRQRVALAMALANEPDLLIADEPTTALDTTVQVEILRLLDDLRARLGMAVLIVSHDLGVVRSLADAIHVMDDGRVVEAAPAHTLFTAPTHPVTRALLGAEGPPGPAPLPGNTDGAPELLRAEGLGVSFAPRGGLFRRHRPAPRALAGVSFHLRRGECLGVVGESGSGKSTLALAVLRLLDAEGRVALDGLPLHDLPPARLRPLRRRMQAVFQDPFASLSPRMTVGESIAEGLAVHGVARAEERRRRALASLEEVGLDADFLYRYPGELSGGQCQRVAIARALALEPDLLVLDEPTSSLDRALQFQIVALLRRLQQRHGMACLFITHDLSLVRSFCHRMLVLRAGRIVEHGASAALFQNPASDELRALLDAARLCDPTAPTGPPSTTAG
ncbi:dipeptide ABC transporter ATP-binding protein [Nitratidesulfovibrio sp. HK-II]|uniref:ABC transporter ATP-binding protein n=1 Tax=Nitratidesulfovibrio sp. HK-II TaxID=2009266 RepID=UPI000E2EE7CC|nr:dipeptide ABC transporter ATP-binding protein [Nitratidesulfovibrio sp. HK-II]GBO97537.1 oligopeptide transport ATP-binding protein OppF [Nitratidesulfovibrio sp. HK-II]